MITLADVNAFYGRAQVLHRISLNVGDGETVALLGRNGVGKTTTLKAIMGLIRREGTITLSSDDISSLASHKISRQGVQLVPENRGIFAALTVEENLRLGLKADSGWSIDRVYENFPRLADRRRNYGDRLSGGEQQMLAIARALVADPRLLLLDEPSEGLAPVIVEQIADVLRVVHDEGISVLLVEQRLDFCLALAQRIYVLETGRIVFDGTTEEFEADPSIRDKYLALAVAE
ncbi:MAG: ABC transporter ATP-binding protein [Dermatophilaceae bacterium]